MNICIFGAASNTIHPDFIKEGERLGAAIAQGGHTVVFGGGANGLMGAVARGAHGAGGAIIGVAPTFFPDGVLFPHCTGFHHTETMHERKALMEELSDAFIVAPGGIGTYEELLEVYTLRHLDRHEKPIALLNTRGFFEPLLTLLAHTAREGFLPERDLGYLHAESDVDALLAYIEGAAR